ncbi:unnamed protein product [Phytophthora lilii]|uniref:Unnamed protein product n=1 Tax=Phytophthora lilii TaxID=2077276 RepID=A0A9W6U647_9STRA|nr:unnamed protein product [Phytophthora lilii]
MPSATEAKQTLSWCALTRQIGVSTYASSYAYLVAGAAAALLRSGLRARMKASWSAHTSRYAHAPLPLGDTLQFRCLIDDKASSHPTVFVALRVAMGCTSSTVRRAASRLDKVEEAMPASPSLSSSLSDEPVILESPTSSTGYRAMSTKMATPLSVQPPRRRLHRRRRREPHLDHHLSDRLDLLARYLQRASKFDKTDALYVLTQQAIDDLLDNIHSFFIVYESEKRPLWRLAQTGRVVQKVESFHRTLDAITSRCGLAVAAPSGAGSSLPRWQARWRRMRAERLVFFRTYLEDHEAAAVSNSQVREPTDQLELLTLLKHDAQKFDTLLTADELELLERTFTFVASCCDNCMNYDTQMRLMSLPEWFVAPCESAKQQHKWQSAAVTVQKAPQNMSPHECFKLASMWSRLQHPHIMKLFGACHVSRKRFFVVAEGTPLTRCLGDDGFPLWRALYEAALALRYLHSRRVGLDALSCADLVLFRNGDRDAVMLAGFNLCQMKSALESSAFLERNKTNEEDRDPLLEDDENDTDYNDVDVVHREHTALKTLREDSCDGITNKYWQAPELGKRETTGPSEASDIYALGMCVVEAFSGGNVWGNTDIVMGDLLPRPAALDDAWQWALVERMLSANPKERPSLTEVLASFQVFAEEEENTATDFSSSKRRKKSRHYSLRQTQPRVTSSSIACALSEVQAWCDEASESYALNFQLYERMDDVAARLKMMDAETVELYLPVLSLLILRFRDLLQRRVNENRLLRLAATRQVITTNMELHSELDVLMDRLQLERFGASIHSWTSQQASYREQLWKRMRLSLAGDTQALVGELDGERELSLLGAFLAFEVKTRSTYYAAQDLELLQTTLVKVEETYQIMMPGHPPTFRTTESKTTMSLPPWFIPPYEVVFNELDTFDRGSFGSVHFGKWMNSDVVVKKMLTPEEPGAVIPLRSRRGAKSNAKEPDGDPYKQFLNDMSIWFRLKHPNVLKLFGACHVGQHQFFVCEFAAQGPIDSYVASKATLERGVCARRMLHEAALGLHYLHTQNIVHTDLRCCNILVDAYDAVKLTDFGTSSLKNRRLDDMTVESDGVAGNSCRWTAPECLAGQRPTFASNVYSFAMCAIKVVSGELPWGIEATDATIRANIRKGLLPPRPANCFSDSEWNLIERMCCRDPNERITMSSVVKLLV